MSVIVIRGYEELLVLLLSQANPDKIYSTGGVLNLYHKSVRLNHCATKLSVQ